MQRAAYFFGLALAVEFGGNRQRLRVCLDYRISFRAVFVDVINPIEIFSGQGMRRKFPGSHAALQFADRQFIKFECRRWRDGRGVIDARSFPDCSGSAKTCQPDSPDHTATDEGSAIHSFPRMTE